MIESLPLPLFSQLNTKITMTKIILYASFLKEKKLTLRAQSLMNVCQFHCIQANLSEAL